jgi:hypothetical protein
MRSVIDNVVVGGQNTAAYGAILSTFNSSAAVVVTTPSPSIDTKGFNSGALRVYVTPVGAQAITNNNGQNISTVATLQESNDNATWTTANDNTGTAIGGTVVATTTAVLNSFRIEGLGVSNRKRYLRVQLVSCGAYGTLGSQAAAMTTTTLIELGRAYELPPTQTPTTTNT